MIEIKFLLKIKKFKKILKRGLKIGKNMI